MFAHPYKQKKIRAYPRKNSVKDTSIAFPAVNGFGSVRDQTNNISGRNLDTITF